MSTIDEYVKQVSKKYPDTREVREQLEEIRDTLHIKTEENQSSGMGYQEAAQAAINSIGDLSGLMSLVAGDSRIVYVNRLNMYNAMIATIIITVELLLGFAAAFLPVVIDSAQYTPETFGAAYYFLNSISFVRISTNGFWPIFVPVMVATWIWPLISFIMYKKDPHKTEAVKMPFRQLFRMALIGWAVISAGLFAVNIMTDWNTIWFIWPMIGISNWPVNIFNYHRQLNSGKHDA